MCLAFVSIGQHPHFPRILFFNRDEDYQRPAAAAHWWEGGDIFGGRDLLKGGTWAALDRHGKFGALTFIRGPREARTPAGIRGAVVPEWLHSTSTAKEFGHYLLAHCENYLGYNLIYGDRQEIFHFNNHSRRLTKLNSGLYGVSNADLDTPWFKVERGRAQLLSILRSEAADWRGRALEVLLDRTLAPDDQVQQTGLNPQREKLKSGMFITLPDYGTIASSIIAYDRNNQAHILELSFDASRQCTNRVETTFRLA
jgi:uncharacterized protein with NRDE domain